MAMESKSEAHLKNMQRTPDVADAKFGELQAQKDLLDKKLAAQAITVADADAKLQAAKLEAATIARAAATQAWSADVSATAPAAQDQASLVTAAAVKCFFQSLPAKVAEHHEGADAISQVMALLEKLDSAAKQVAAPVPQPSPAAAAISTAAAQGMSGLADCAADMDLDSEELLNNLAEAAVGPIEDESSEAKEHHRKKVAEAKTRLAKVRKTCGKK